MNYKIACNIIVYKKDSILLGKRKKPIFKNKWSLPGGHLEFGEGIQNCATRELEEETGILIKKMRLFFIVEEITATEQYYHFFLCCIVKEKNVEYHNKEIDNFREWKFFPLKNLPKKIITTHKEAINYYRKIARQKKPKCFKFFINL